MNKKLDPQGIFRTSDNTDTCLRYMVNIFYNQKVTSLIWTIKQAINIYRVFFKTKIYKGFKQHIFCQMTSSSSCKIWDCSTLVTPLNDCEIFKEKSRQSLHKRSSTLASTLLAKQKPPPSNHLLCKNSRDPHPDR